MKILLHEMYMNIDFVFLNKKLQKENHSRLLFRLKNLRVCNKHH